MKNLLFFLLLGSCLFAQSQSYVHQVYVLNEGYMDFQTNQILEPVTLASYHPQSQTYTIIDTIEGMRFASDALIAGDYLYIAADTKILKYNKYTNELVANVTCTGVRNLAVFQDKLVATRGEYQTTFSSYLHIYDANTLQLLTAIDTVLGPKWASQNIIVDGIKAYIAVNNGYEIGNEKGIIGILDLNSLIYGSEVDLGENGKNPDNLVKKGEFIYAVNNRDWTGSSISKVGLNGVLQQTVNLSNASTGCGTSCLRNGNIIYQLAGDVMLHEFDVAVMNLSGPVASISKNFYEIAEDTINGLLYASSTDFFSYGTVDVYNSSNELLSSFDAGVSPGTVVFDVRTQASGIEESDLVMDIYPNPATDIIQIQADKTGILQIINSLGQVVLSFEINEGSNVIDIEKLHFGIYQLILSTESTRSTKQLIVD